jgi:transposase InsO family protein
VVLDAATRLIVGWSVNLSENVIAVGDALRHAVGQYGILPSSTVTTVLAKRPRRWIALLMASAPAWH